MKKRVGLLLLIICIMMSGCSSNIKDAAKIEETAIYIETPLFITNGMVEFGRTDPTGELFPIKSWELVETNADIARIEFVEPDEVNIPEGYTSSKFKYKDLSKYSNLAFYFTTNKVEHKYDYHFTCEFKAKFKVEFYEDELQDRMKKNYHLLTNKNYVVFNMFDYYNGTIQEYTINLEEEKYKNATDKEIIIEWLNYIKQKTFTQLVQVDSEFTEIAEHIRENFTSDSTYDKAHAIYSWIADNIKFDNTRLEIFNQKADEIDYEKELNNYFSIEKTLEHKKGTCGDFAYLFDALATYHGLTSWIYTGKSSYGTEESFHSWNVVPDHVNNQIILIDSGFGTTDRKNNFVSINSMEHPDIKFLKEHFIWNEDMNEYTTFTVDLQ